MHSQFSRWPALLALLVSAAGCLPNRPYRTGDRAVERQVSGAQDYGLAYIEFDEQGDFWDRDQLKQAVDLIKTTTKPLLVVYVHGWQNNASDATNDVPQFHRVLEKLARTEGVRRLQYQVVGVYLGWRGKQAYDPVFKVLSFPNRKDAAVRIGSSNTITEAIFRVVYEARRRPERARTILIGHSFGALVVERAVEQAMTGGVLSGSPVLPGDLVLLINSAAESIYAKEMRDMMVSTLHFATGQKCYQREGDAECYMKDEPRIISVTSETDRATGVAFPIGASLFGLGKLYREYDAPGGARVSQRLFFTHTPGHNDRLLDHAIVPLTIDPPKPEYPDGFEQNLALPQALPASGADDQATPIFATGGELTANGTTTPWRWWRINYTGNATERSPFWIVKVPKEILDGHGDIFNPNAVDMMAALFRSSTVMNLSDAAPPAIKVKSEPTTTGQPLTQAAPLAAPAPSPSPGPNELVGSASAAAAPAPVAQAPSATASARRRHKPRKRTRRSAFLKLTGREVVK